MPRSSLPLSLVLACWVPAASAQLSLNEVRARPGGGPYEFVELLGAPGSSLDGHAILGVRGDGPAVLFLALDLTGHVVQGDGLFVAGGSLVPGADLLLPDSGVLVDGTQTLYLVETDDVAALRALVGSDVDPDGDRVTAIPSLARIRDIVALADVDYQAGLDRIYDGAQAFVSRDSFAPSGIFRGGDAPSGWCDRFLDPVVQRNTDFQATPGEPNLDCPIYIPQTLELRALDGEPEDRFGSSLALDGDRAVVGAPWEDELGPDRGAAYLFDLSTGAQVAKLLPSDLDDWSRWFGRSVAMDGGLVVVGTGYASSESGAAYVFDAATGAQLAKLLPDVQQPGQGFGESVAIEDGIAVVGAFNHDQRGAAFVFDALSGQQLAELRGDLDSDDFGAAVAVRDGLVLVGDPHDSEQGWLAGAAWLFDLASGTQLAKLQHDDPGVLVHFGLSVDLRDGLAIVGAERDTPEATSGRAYVFDVASGTQLNRLRASDESEGDLYGWSVAMGSGVALVGAPRDDEGASTGVVYAFDPQSGVELARLRAIGQLPDEDGFGYWRRLAADGASILVGADGTPEDAGTVYLFRRPFGSAYCAAAPNSVSSDGARLWAVGSDRLSAETLSLLAEGVPPQPGLFFFGATRTQVPFGDGFRCVGGALRRLPLAMASGGVLRTEVDFGVYGAELALLGTVHFQGWYRDPVANQTGFNLTDARTIEFVP